MLGIEQLDKKAKEEGIRGCGSDLPTVGSRNIGASALASLLLATDGPGSRTSEHSAFVIRNRTLKNHGQRPGLG